MRVISATLIIATAGVAAAAAGAATAIEVAGSFDGRRGRVCLRLQVLLS